MPAYCPTCQNEFPEENKICPNDNTALILKPSPLANTAPSPSEVVAVKPPEPTAELVAGAKIGEYVVEKKIGEGGMGEVWGGRHPHIGKRVAIKILSERLSSNRKVVTRFVNEAKAVNEIQHRHIVDIFSFGELPSGRPYFVMEFLQGKSLSDHIKENGPMPFSEILLFWEQICRALQAAHARKIIHRDLKPDNLFLVIEEGAPIFVKVLDFGIAKLSTEEQDNAKGGLTATGAVMGTAAYMSPEQCEGAKAVDQRSDIYSMGIILFQMITGRTPFQEPGEGLGSIIAKHLHQEVPLTTSMVSGRIVPQSVETFLARALAKNPNDRPQQCNDFYTELVKAVGDKKNEEAAAVAGAKPRFGASQGETPKPLSSLTTKTPAPASPSKAPLSIALAVLLVASLGIFYVSTQSKAETSNNPQQPASPPKTLDPALITEALKGVNPQPCYDSASTPTSKSEVQFQISISAQGKVLLAKPKGEGISSEVDSCISQKIQSLTFPASSANTETTHSFSFTPKPAPTTQPEQKTVEVIVFVNEPGVTVSVDGKVIETLAADKKFLKLALPYNETKESTISIEKDGFETVKEVVLPVVGRQIQAKLKKPIKKTTTTTKWGEDGVKEPPKLPK